MRNTSVLECMPKSDRKNKETEFTMVKELITKIQKTNAPIVVGLDPMLSYVPSQVKEKAFGLAKRILQMHPDRL